MEEYIYILNEHLPAPRTRLQSCYSEGEHNRTESGLSGSQRGENSICYGLKKKNPEEDKPASEAKAIGNSNQISTGYKALVPSLHKQTFVFRSESISRLFRLFGKRQRDNRRNLHCDLGLGCCPTADQRGL